MGKDGGGGIGGVDDTSPRPYYNSKYNDLEKENNRLLNILKQLDKDYGTNYCKDKEILEEENSIKSKTLSSKDDTDLYYLIFMYITTLGIFGAIILWI